jgi:hypothetical protein
VYPNPSIDEFNLDVYSGMETEDIHIEVFDNYGVKLVDKLYPAAAIITGESLNLSSAEKGIYHLKVSIGGQVQSQLLFKN